MGQASQNQAFSHGSPFPWLVTDFQSWRGGNWRLYKTCVISRTLPNFQRHPLSKQHPTKLLPSRWYSDPSLLCARPGCLPSYKHRWALAAVLLLLVFMLDIFDKGKSAIDIFLLPNFLLICFASPPPTPCSVFTSFSVFSFSCRLLAPLTSICT